MGGCTTKNTVIQGSVIKIGLIGDALSGKSSILLRFAENRFNSGYLHNTKNFAVIKSYLVNDKKQPVTVEVWELQTQNVIQLDVIVIVADSTMSVSDLQDYYWKWLQYCKAAGWENISIVLSKSDLNSNINQEFLNKIRENLVLEPNQLLLKTSASKNEGIDSLFKSIISRYLSKI